MVEQSEEGNGGSPTAVGENNEGSLSFAAPFVRVVAPARKNNYASLIHTRLLTYFFI